MIKSERAGKWIADTTTPINIKSTSRCIHAAELAEWDARERAKRAFCVTQCWMAIRKDCDERIYDPQYEKAWGAIIRDLPGGGMCRRLVAFLDVYDKENLGI